MKLRTWQIGLALAAGIGASSATAQTTIYGIDFRGDNFFMSDTADFVGNWTSIGTNAEAVYALDFDETNTTLWGVENSTTSYGSFDLTTGAWTSLGFIAGTGNLGATGVTCATDGTWYLCEWDGVASQLYVGDLTTGIFTLVGPIDTGIIIDISIDSQGNLYGNSISTDALFSIDTTTGVGTSIGPTGFATNYAQGMDFDWSDDTLYATLYTGTGTGAFATIDLTTGAATQLADTFPLNAEMEMACVSAPPGPPGIQYCPGDGTGTPCPFANNNNGSMGGCDWGNAAFPTGGVLAATGSDVWADNNTILVATAIENNFGIFFGADNAVNGGNGNPLNDGLRCAGGALVRLTAPTMASGNMATLPAPIQTLDTGGGMGVTRRYQYWFRTPNGPGGQMANLTNGYEIAWL